MNGKESLEKSCELEGMRREKTRRQEKQVREHFSELAHHSASAYTHNRGLRVRKSPTPGTVIKLLFPKFRGGQASASPGVYCGKRRCTTTSPAVK